jgi:DNA-binding NtrC family response regulator
VTTGTPHTGTDATELPVQFGTRLPTMRECNWLLMQEALMRTGQNRSAAAALLGISRQTLLNHLKVMRISESTAG